MKVVLQNSSELLETYFDKLVVRQLRGFCFTLIAIYGLYIVHRMLTWSGWQRTYTLQTISIGLLLLITVRHLLNVASLKLFRGAFCGYLIACWIAGLSAFHAWFGLEPQFTEIVFLVMASSGVILLNKRWTLLTNITLFAVWVVTTYFKTGVLPKEQVTALLSAGVVTFFFLNERRQLFSRNFSLIQSEADQNRLLGQAIERSESYKEELRRRIPDWVQKAEDAHQELQQETRSHLELLRQLADQGAGDPVGQMAGGVAHDLNNLLTVLNFNLEELEGERRPENFDSLDSIKFAVGEIEDIVSQLLAFSRKQSLQKQSIKVNALLKEFTNGLGGLLNEDIQVVCSLSEPDLEIWADKAQIYQALLNITINAADSMPNGGKLRFSSQAIGERLLICVQDSGRGMEAEELESCRAPYFTTKGLHSGRGLGLSVVEGIVRQHSGELSLESEVGVGTIVRLEFSLKRAKRTSKRIALAGETESTKLLLNQFFAYRGFQVETVDSPSVLRDILGGPDGPPGCVVMESSWLESHLISLDNMRRQLNQTRIIVLSQDAHRHPFTLRDMRYLIEPYSLSELLELAEQNG